MLYRRLVNWVSIDILTLLENAVTSLPSGEYSTGLDAIVRHVKSAIRHFERDQELDPDSCTDAIYRTNQAYEGSLKEAYRVLADKDPAKMSPFQIEEYLEENNVVRPRVLTQLTRYRQDYRNPSTHDYKLDFDSDEALLAIVSVCGFSKLLINQISSKLASDAAQAKLAGKFATNNALNQLDFLERVARISHAYTKESGSVGWFEFERGIANTLIAAGLEAKLLTSELELEEHAPESFWDVIVQTEHFSVGIDARVSRGARRTNKVVDPIGYENILECEDVNASVLILRDFHTEEYSIYKADQTESPLFIICESHDDIQLNGLRTVFGPLLLVDKIEV